jgi:hypothetical protein
MKMGLPLGSEFDRSALEPTSPSRIDREPGSAAVDATHDDAATSVQTNDSLVLRSAVVELAPGMMQCLESIIVHSDGTETMPDPSMGTLRATLTDPTVAMPSAPSDCALAGVIGLGAGTTVAHVTYAQGSVTLTAVASIHVNDYRLVWSLSPVSAIGAGYSVELTMPAGLPHLVDSSQAPVNLRGATWVARWFDLSTGEPATATVTRVRNDRVLLRGVAPGTTTLTQIYRIPDHPLSGMSVMVDVRNGGTLQGVSSIDIRAADGLGLLEDAQIIPPGTCFTASLVGRFVDGQGTYFDNITGATWPVVEGTLRMMSAGPPVQFCADSPGSIFFAGCAGAECRSMGFPVFTAGSVLTLAATLTMSGPVTGEATTDGYLHCPSLDVEVHLAGGTSQNVAASAVVSWSSPADLMNIVQLRRDVTTRGAINDAGGRPCFLVDQAVTTVMPSALDIGYAGKQTRAQFDVGP